MNANTENNPNPSGSTNNEGGRSSFRNQHGNPKVQLQGLIRALQNITTSFDHSKHKQEPPFAGFMVQFKF